jgi:transcription elongation factor Elf1
MDTDQILSIVGRDVRDEDFLCLFCVSYNIPIVYVNTIDRPDGRFAACKACASACEPENNQVR